MGYFTDKAKEKAKEKALSTAHKVRKSGNVQVGGPEEAKVRALALHNKKLGKLNKDLKRAKASKDAGLIKAAEGALSDHRKEATKISKRKIGGLL
jgi:hypothetical protein